MLVTGNILDGSEWALMEHSPWLTLMTTKLVLIYSELMETNLGLSLKVQIKIIEYIQKKDKNIVYQELWKHTLLKVML